MTFRKLWALLVYGVLTAGPTDSSAAFVLRVSSPFFYSSDVTLLLC